MSEIQATCERANAALAMPTFFVLGCPKSGTTWVQKLLHAHPKLACRGETKLLPDGLHALTQAIQFANNKQNIGPGFGYTNDEIRYLFAQMLGLALARFAEEKPDAKWVGEKTPFHTLYVELLSQLCPQSRFVHIIRDGRDAAISGYFHNLKQNKPNFKKDLSTLPWYVELFARDHWVKFIQTARAFGERCPDRYVEVRYEDLHAAPEENIAKILGLLEVDASPAVIESMRDAASFKTLSAGRTRGEEDKGSHYRKGVIGDWANHFDPASLAVYKRYAGELATELGYTD